MDKINFNALGAAHSETAAITLISGATIEVISRIPYEQVFEMIEWCVNKIVDDRSFISAPLKEVMTSFALLKNYTNLDCTFLENIFDIKSIYENYDIADASGVIPAVEACIDADQLAFFKRTLKETLESIVAYRNSAKGLVDVLSQNATEQTSTMEEALEFINNPEKREEVEKLLNFYSEDFSRSVK